MPTVHAFDYLESPPKFPAERANVLFGDDRFLQLQVLQRLRDQVLSGQRDPLFATFDGESCDWPSLNDELATRSLFGANGKRLAVVEEADSFVSANRDRLESYVQRPHAKSVLVLVVGSWAKNTNLYKLVEKSGLQIECSPPYKSTSKSSSNKSVDEPKIHRWIASWAKKQHDIQMQPVAAEQLLDLVGPNFGLLDQDLAKLALFVTPGEVVTAELVARVVGGWRSKTTWDLIDAATDGDAGEALLQLDRMFQSGSVALEVMGAIAWSLRRYAAATRIFEQAERSGRKITLAAAVEGAGIKNWPPGNLLKAEKRLIQLGRDRAGKFYSWLVDIDAALKGSHSAPDRSRDVVEQLVVRLSAQLNPRNAKK